MKATEFVYWLQGVFELGDVKSFDEKQTSIIKNHLAVVFKHDIDPSAGSVQHQIELSNLHEGKKPVKISGPFGPTLRC